MDFIIAFVGPVVFLIAMHAIMWKILKVDEWSEFARYSWIAVIFSNVVGFVWYITKR